jgi:hypothetical protein
MLAIHEPPWPMISPSGQAGARQRRDTQEIIVAEWQLFFPDDMLSR